MKRTLRGEDLRQRQWTQRKSGNRAGKSVSNIQTWELHREALVLRTLSATNPHCSIPKPGYHSNWKKVILCLSERLRENSEGQESGVSHNFQDKNIHC